MGGQQGGGDGKLEFPSVPLGFMKDPLVASSTRSCLLLTFTLVFSTTWTFRHCPSGGLGVVFWQARGEPTSSLASVGCQLLPAGADGLDGSFPARLRKAHEVLQIETLHSV